MERARAIVIFPVAIAIDTDDSLLHLLERMGGIAEGWILIDPEALDEVMTT
jgi:hypothetical protein